MALRDERVMRDALNVSGEVPIYVVNALEYTEDARVVAANDGLRIGVTGECMTGFFRGPASPGLRPRDVRGARGDRRGLLSASVCQRFCQRTAHNRAAGGRR